MLVVTSIVKNESYNIVNTFSKFVDFGIKDILIVDTGSDDDTCEKIRNLSNSIILGHCEFKSYSYARNKALMMCNDIFPHCRWILMIDASYEPINLNSLMENILKLDLKNDYYYIDVVTEGNIIIKRPILIRIGSAVKYEGILHEDITHNIGLCGGCIENFYMKAISIDGNLRNDNVNEGNKEKKEEENKELLKTKNRNRDFDIPFYSAKSELNISDMFHLAQAYHNIADIKKAIEWYAKIIDIERKNEENKVNRGNEINKEKNEKNRKKENFFSYISNYRLGCIYQEMNENFLAMIYYFGAIECNNNRCEPYVKLSEITTHETQYMWIKKACSVVKTNKVDEIFFELDTYNTKRHIMMAKSCLLMKRYKEGLSALEKIENVEKLNKINEKIEIKELKRLLSRKIVVVILTSPGYEDYNKIMDKYLSTTELEYYFYESSNKYNSITVENHKIWIPGEETIIPGIEAKTKKILKIFSDYDYVIRLNSTTFIDLRSIPIGNEEFMTELNTNINKKSTNINKGRINYDYYGYFNSNKLSLNPEYGVDETFLKKVGKLEFVSGKCIILSKKAIDIYCKSSYDSTMTVDDISIARVMKDYFRIEHLNFFNFDVFCPKSRNTLTFFSSPAIMEHVIDNNVPKIEE